MPYRTLEGFSIISALFKTYYAMFFLVFATQYFVSLRDTFKFKRRPYFSLNATLWGFKPHALYQRLTAPKSRFIPRLKASGLSRSRPTL
jgi:hypothetical protein